MLAHTKKPLIRQKTRDVIHMRHKGMHYQFPRKIAEKYRINNESVKANEVFTEINKKYTKPGALLRGIRIREGLTQVELAKIIQMTQSDISQMENGTRNIGRKIAKRIGKFFDIDYRSFLE